MTPTSVLIDDLKKVQQKINKIPSRKEYNSHGSFHDATISRRFGSWNKALKSTFGEVVRIKPPNRPIIKCLSCGEKTKNPKYCSSSCAAKINNGLFPKRPKRKCLRCGTPTTSKTHYCQKCLSLNKIEEYSEKTIDDFQSTYARHKYQQIRNHAHRIAHHHNLTKNCPFCDYENHFHLCHIKDISKFPKDTKLKVVNDLKNLIFLCPNHHWDLDHDKLKL